MYIHAFTYRWIATLNENQNRIRFSRERQGGHGTAFQFCGKYISCVEYVDHLGHIISYDLQNDLDIQRCKRDFIRRANGVLSRFGFCTPEVLTQLLHTYCMSFYGCALWNLCNRSIKALDICINKVLLRIWSLPYNCHTDILHLVAGSDSIFNVCYNCSCKLLCSANISCNHLVRSVFQGSSLSCRNFIGYNLSMALILLVTTVV